jgi:hypothetical protein
MKIPEFTAQASLYKTSNRYRSSAQPGEPQRTVVIPQLGGPGFEGWGNCFSDCRDAHPDWTPARCSARCRDPGGMHVPGSGIGYGYSCEASPPSECYWLFTACCGPTDLLWGCLVVCGDLLRGCLEESRRECLIASHVRILGGSSYPRSGVVRMY